MNKKKIAVTAGTIEIKDVENARAVKLSKAQKELIKKMQLGDICHYMRGINAKCFLANTQKNVS